MKILLPEHLGMCFGVPDAIAEAEQRAAEAPLTILGELPSEKNSSWRIGSKRSTERIIKRDRTADYGYRRFSSSANVVD